MFCTLKVQPQENRSTLVPDPPQKTPELLALLPELLLFFVSARLLAQGGKLTNKCEQAI